MVDPLSDEIRHERLAVNRIEMHCARLGSGRPLLLLHGWPEFWLTWEPVMRRLAKQNFAVIAPDLRGFGETGKPDALPSDRVGAEAHASDLLTLLGGLGLERVGIVSHDVGAYVAQVMGRRAPERLAGLFFFDCPYPGIGRRWAEPLHLKEIWYQSFHQLPWAAAMVGASRETCRLYFAHFLRHWSGGNPHAFDDVLEAWVDNFMRPGNLQGGFDWYISQNTARLAAMRGEVPPQAKITVPACIRWGTLDPVLKAEWGDRLGDYFTDLDFRPLDGLGHFPHREDPERAAAEIASYFDGLKAERW